MAKLQHKHIKGQRLVVFGYARFVDFKGCADFPQSVAVKMVEKDDKWSFFEEIKPEVKEVVEIKEVKEINQEKVEFVQVTEIPKVKKASITKKPSIPAVHDKMTKNELLEIAREMGIEIPSKSLKVAIYRKLKKEQKKLV